MKTRIFTNWKTTLTGVVILTISILAVVYKYATFDQVVGFITLAGGFAWVKDSVFKVNPEK